MLASLTLAYVHKMLHVRAFRNIQIYVIKTNKFTYTVCFITCC